MAVLRPVCFRQGLEIVEHLLQHCPSGLRCWAECTDKGQALPHCLLAHIRCSELCSLRLAHANLGVHAATASVKATQQNSNSYTDGSIGACIRAELQFASLHYAAVRTL